MVRPKKWGEVSPPTTDNEKIRRTDEIFEDNYYKLPANKLVQLRLVGDQVVPVGTHWIEIITPKQKRKISVGAVCPAFNPETESTDPNEECKACDADVQRNVRYVTTAIVRSKQDKGERNPVYVIELPMSVADKIVELTETNVVRKKSGERVGVPISHPKYGCDVFIKYDPSKSPTNMYFVSKGDRTPLTKEERNYEIPDLQPLIDELEKKDIMRKKINELMKRAILKDDEGGDEYDEEEVAAEDWEEGEIEEADNWDEDEDDTSYNEDDELEDADEEDDEFDDEEGDLDLEDEDEFEEDEEEEEDNEGPPWEEDDEEEEERRRRARARARAKAKAKAKKKKSKVKGKAKSKAKAKKKGKVKAKARRRRR